MKKPFSYIGSVNSSAKILKGEQINLDTFVIYLAPFNSSGHNTCPLATNGTEEKPGCVQLCLNESGRVILDTAGTILKARINKTNFFYSNRAEFVAMLAHEIAKAKTKAEKTGRKFCVRLNGTSDLSPLTFKHPIGLNILELFPNLQFYDYTKVPNRFKLLEKYKNYHLTFSFSGHNWADCEQILKNGHNVAAVFNVKKGKELPKSYKGFTVIDGDINDYRPADPLGCIVGLRFKRIKNKAMNQAAINSPFVLSVN